MRTYYIYKQTAKPIRNHNYYSEYRWMPYEYIGYVTGTKELYNVMRRFLYGFPHYGKTEIVKSFDYSTELFIKQHGYSIEELFYYSLSKGNSFTRRITTERYAIVDDKGNFRDYYSLTERYKKKYCCRQFKYCGQIRRPKYSSVLRKQIEPEELREIKQAYGSHTLSLKQKKTINNWDVPEGYRISRCWKDQSKRKHQWKEKR